MIAFLKWNERYKYGGLVKNNRENLSELSDEKQKLFGQKEN
jgi:hypothetical protein